MQSITFTLPEYAQTPATPSHYGYEGKGAHGDRFDVNSYYFEFNGKPVLPLMGEFQYSRYPAEEWQNEILKMKAGGIQFVGTYVFWIHHEEEEGQFEWSGRYDLGKFISLCAAQGLWVILRMGPFCHGEARNGGLPDWIYGRAFEPRTNDPRYLFYVNRLYQQIGLQVKGQTFREGGPIIGIQCENEFMDSIAPWETTQLPAMDFTPKGGGPEHMLVLKKMAVDAGLNVPFYTATGWGKSPILEEEFLPLYGGYAFHGWADPSKPQNPTDLYIFKNRYDRTRSWKVPFACCELAGGMQPFYLNRPVVPPASIEALQVVSLGSGTNLVGYYVYHGGSNPVGRRTFMNEHRCPRISYDFQAPIGEFGQLNESYHRLRRQFFLLHAWGEKMAPMGMSLPDGEMPIPPDDTDTLRVATRSQGDAAFLFLNNYQDHLDLPERGPVTILVKTPNQEIRIPADGALYFAKEVCAILPVGLDLGGVKLRYATAQPLTILHHGKITHHFFYEPRGLKAEYSFEADETWKLGSAHGSVMALPNKVVKIDKPGLSSTLKFSHEDGRQVWITTLSDEESLAFWKAPVFGRERIVMSKTDILFHGEDFDFLVGAESENEFHIWPAPDVKYLSGKKWETKIEGDYLHAHVIFPPAVSRIEVERIADHLAVIHLPAGELDKWDELIVRTSYCGDMGMAHVDGKLIHDNFNSGQPWEMGLKRFVPKDKDVEIVLTILKGKMEVKADEMASIQAVASDKADARIYSVEIVPRRRIPS